MIKIKIFINESPKKINENIKNLIDHEYMKGDSRLISRRFMQKYFYILNIIGKFGLLNMLVSQYFINNHWFLSQDMHKFILIYLNVWYMG